MLKKIITLTIGIVILFTGAAGVYLYKNYHQDEAHGVIVLDQDKEKLTNTIASQKKDIKSEILVQGKWLEDSKTLVLNPKEAQLLADNQVIKKVTVSKKDEYHFTPIKAIPQDKVTLFSKEKQASIKDEDGNEVSTSNYEYAVLGESSSFVNNLLILPVQEYDAFTASPITLGALKIKSDAYNALIHYTELKINQTYDAGK